MAGHVLRKQKVPVPGISSLKALKWQVAEKTSAKIPDTGYLPIRVDMTDLAGPIEEGCCQSARHAQHKLLCHSQSLMPTCKTLYHLQWFDFSPLMLRLLTAGIVLYSGREVPAGMCWQRRLQKSCCAVNDKLGSGLSPCRGQESALVNFFERQFAYGRTRIMHFSFSLFAYK